MKEILVSVLAGGVLGFAGFYLLLAYKKWVGIE